MQDLQKLAAKSSRILWVTAGAVMDVQDPTLTPIVGLARTLRNEYSELRSQTIDLDPKASAADNVKTLVSLLNTQAEILREENELAVRANQVCIHLFIFIA